jgi:HD-GYP domain-containing protein (c-di-GMP phosphodiesterase class II)
MEIEQTSSVPQEPNTGPPVSDLHTRIADSLAKVAGCARSISLYGRAHPVLQEMVQSTREALMQALASEPSVTLAVADTYLASESFPIEDRSGSLKPFVKALQDRGVGEIRFDAGITTDEIADFAEALSTDPGELSARGGMREVLRQHDVVNIYVRGNASPTETREGEDPADVYEEALVLIEEALDSVRNRVKIPVDEIKTVVSDSLENLTNSDDALLALASIRSYDRYLSEHSVNVCFLSMVFGRTLGIDARTAVDLGVAAMLHDVGKVFIPDDIVKKPGKLSEEEWEQVRRHPIAGARALAGTAGLPPLCSTIALEHHVYCDGTGYPSLAGNEKPHFLSRLVSIADTYDALTSERPYRDRWSGVEAIAWMLYEETNRYDREMVARFAARAGLYPIGSFVRLENGALAIVTGGSRKHPLRPTLRLVSEEDMTAQPEIIDLSQSTDPGLEIKDLAQPVEALLPYADKLLAA